MKKVLITLGLAALSTVLPQGISAQGNAVTVTANGVSFKMIKVEGGSFTMGTPQDVEGGYYPDYDNERPAHRVTLSTYYIGETEVTQELWQAVMGTNPSRFAPDRLVAHCGYDVFVKDAQKINAASPGSVQIPTREQWNAAMTVGGSTQRPVEWVSWADCQEFILRLNLLTGKHFRLPTEAEWEFAARGGNKSRGYKYSGSDNIDEVAWYKGNTHPEDELDPNYGPHPVKTKMPNELGIYDMTGNVSEWCQDWSAPYSAEPQTNPKGPDNPIYETREMRGGGWDISAFQCRCATRNLSNHPQGKRNNDGLRLVMEP